MNCCAGCFEDEVLTGHINGAGETGDCDFCGARDVPVVEATDLWDLFEPVVRLYRDYTADNVPPQLVGDWSEPLATLLQDDWEIFSEAVCDFRHELVAAIIPVARHKDEILDYPDAGGLYVSPLSARCDESPSEYWNDFVKHITTERRYVLRTSGNVNHISSPIWDPWDRLRGNWFAEKTVIPAGTGVWRARLCDGQGVKADPDAPPSAAQLGPPPAEDATAGRANAAGIPVFYGAFSAHTAAAEVRPAIGQHVWVAQWRLKSPARILDLAGARRLPSPFGPGSLSELLDERWFVEAVSTALSLPVVPNEEQIRYVPTQYLVEAIKEGNNEEQYDGVAYGSSQHPEGKNIVLFEKGILDDPVDLQLVRTTGVTFTFDPDLPSSEETPTPEGQEPR